MNSLPACIMLAAVALSACNSASSRDEEAAAAAVSHRENAAAAAAGAAEAAVSGSAAGVTGFDIMDGHGDPTGRWTQTGPSQWNSHNLNSGEQGAVAESGRSSCCILLAMPNGETWTADFDQMQLSGAFGSLPIANVVR